MGDIDKILASTKQPDQLYKEQFRAKREECIALYWRNIRISMTENQLQEIMTAIGSLGTTNLVNTIIGPEILQGIKIELNKNGIVHIHYGDVRIEMHRNEFIEFSDIIYSAAEALKTHV